MHCLTFTDPPAHSARSGVTTLAPTANPQKEVNSRLREVSLAAEQMGDIA
jgi:hypothetical protein